MIVHAKERCGEATWALDLRLIQILHSICCTRHSYPNVERPEI
jgi:hypothetical protein